MEPAIICKRHNLSVRTYPHTNYVLAYAIYVIGVGVKFAQQLMFTIVP